MTNIFQMNTRSENIPVYSLRSFSTKGGERQQFQIEVFDANRHFSVEYPHRHDFFEVLYLSKGTGFHVIDSNKYEIKPPCIFFMSPGQAHKIDFSNDIEGYIFIFTAEFYLLNKTNRNRLIEFPFFFTVQQDNPPLLLENINDIEFFEGLFRRGTEEFSSAKYNVDMLSSLLDLILTTSATLYKTGETKVNRGRGHILVKKFFQLVEENHKNNFSVAQYAGMLSITPNHLTQTVNKLTGKTSLQIIKAKQILEIKRLLVHTNLTVSEIAINLNFPDQSYLAKFFKRETGVSPKDYRNRAME